ncbi:MAG: aspartate--ammonia ligase [Candidatus Azobacteroides sp.]|nr:aspartate--ammonia ligase [Candidatus Azobacteroides sp.]
MPLYIPQNYRPTLVPEMTEQAIKLLKDSFQQRFSQALNLRRVTAPLFVLSDTGVNDDLSGVEEPVSFSIPAMNGRKAEIVHSLAKWKRIKLGEYGIHAGWGLYTDMNAIRTGEDLDNIHSLYVDQWDWERTIDREDRNIRFLKKIVDDIFLVLKETEWLIYKTYHHIAPVLPDKITYIHSEELLAMYPDLSPKERENKITEKYKAVFIIGIGKKLSNGEQHDGRAPDYDDWITPNEDGYFGLNGDILLWNPTLQSAFEVSSMGIRVDGASLKKQLEITGQQNKMKYDFHKKVYEGRLPLSIGGGIGQSRLCMFFLRNAHIGEVHASIWPEDMIKKCAENNIVLK